MKRPSARARRAAWPPSELKLRLDGALGVAVEGGSKLQRLSVATERKPTAESHRICQALCERGGAVDFSILPDELNTLINTMFVLYVLGDANPRERKGRRTHKVTASFPLDSDVLEWGRLLFDFFKTPFPEINAQVSTSARISSWPAQSQNVVTFSGGKDSTFISLSKDAIPVHVAGMQRSCQLRELRSVDVLSLHLKYPVHVIPLTNSVQLGNGSIRYHVRDALVWSLLLSVAYPNGSRQCYTGAYTGDRYFTTMEAGYNGFNELLRKKGIPLTVRMLKRRTEEGIIRSFLENWPDLMQMTAPCVLDQATFARFRALFRSRFPQFPLTEGMCGVCGKCTQMVLAFLLYHPKLREVQTEKLQDVASYALGRAQDESNSSFVEAKLVQRVERRFGSGSGKRL